MNRDTSIYLDGARFFAALTVVAGHTEWSFAPGFMPFIREYHLATLAVGIFFVLSGFVIGYAVDRNETDARSYFLNLGRSGLLGCHSSSAADIVARYVRAMAGARCLYQVECLECVQGVGATSH